MGGEDVILREEGVVEKVGGGGGAMEHGIEGIEPGTGEGGYIDECSIENITSEKSAEVMGRDSLPGADDASTADMEWV